MQRAEVNRARHQLRLTLSAWLTKSNAAVMGITTITAPQTRLLRKAEREGVTEADARLAHSVRELPAPGPELLKTELLNRMPYAVARSGSAMGNAVATDSATGCCQGVTGCLHDMTCRITGCLTGCCHNIT
ncbi:MAG: hypothetical protein TE42_05955, partial [Candidatus Synechococcus spongiarum SP3]